MHLNRRRIKAVLVVATILILGLAAPASAAPQPAPPDLARTDRDWEVPVVDVFGASAAIRDSSLSADPHGLVPKFAFVKRYSLDTDHFEVWLCGSVSSQMEEVIAQLEGVSVGYFEALSGGRYRPTFSAGGVLPNDPHCVAGFLGDDPDYTPAGTPEGLIIVDSVTGGGFATPGPVCGGDSADCPLIARTFPANGRYATVGENALFGYPAVAVHEMGHTLQWPHSYSGLSPFEYDNPIDVMSGNSTSLGTRYTEPLPYATASYNRYQSGWVSPDDVVVASTPNQTVTLEPYDVAGTQLLAVKTGMSGQFYVLGARKSSRYDPIPPSWEGVEVYFVDHNCAHPLFGTLCPGLFREHHQEPPTEFLLDHVLQPGDSIELAGITVAVVASTATGFHVVVEPEAAPDVGSGLFVDDDDSLFEGDIDWLAESGITAGCNPPLGNLYCPEGNVTRGQMAAFLARALNLQGTGDDRFSDDDTSTFELDIERLAAAGITAGCNPPGNDRYCPNEPVTRGQMAAFLARALDLPDTAAAGGFVDSDDSVFADDIERLAAAGITAGCNPPGNDRYCPNEPVTRGQMAAFLRRALDR